MALAVREKTGKPTAPMDPHDHGKRTVTYPIKPLFQRVLKPAYANGDLIFCRYPQKGTGFQKNFLRICIRHLYDSQIQLMPQYTCGNILSARLKRREIRCRLHGLESPTFSNVIPLKSPFRKLSMSHIFCRT